MTETLLTHSSLVVTPEWLTDRLDHPDLRLLDVRSVEAYAEGHIPGAVRVELSTLSREVGGVAGMLLPPDEYSARLGELGVDESKLVVVYDDNWGMPAARVLWGLRRYGHVNVALLTGGWDRWIEEGRQSSTDDVTPPSVHFVVRQDDAQIAVRPWILQQLGHPDLVLIDTRTPAEFEQGHVPGAVNWDWMNGVPEEGWDALRQDDAVRDELAALGVTPGKEVVTYCRSGARASHTYVLLRELGFERVRNYDGSWLEWSQFVPQSGGH
ncbi:MAG: sulfurtransferase [Caldilineaceae bacterium]